MVSQQEIPTISNPNSRLENLLSETREILSSLDKQAEELKKKIAESDKPHNHYRNNFPKRVADSSLLAAGGFGIGISAYVGAFAEMFGQNLFSVGLSTLDGLGVVGMLYFMSPVVRDLFRRDY